MPEAGHSTRTTVGHLRNANRPSQIIGAPSQVQAPHLSMAFPPPPSSFTMNVRTATLPLKLRIWQQNAHKSKAAYSYILNTANPNNWDVIALQEPWFDSYGNSRGTQF